MERIELICIITLIVFIFLQTYWYDISVHEGILIISVHQAIESKRTFQNISLIRRIIFTIIKSFLPLECFLFIVGRRSIEFANLIPIMTLFIILTHKMNQNSEIAFPIVNYSGFIRQLAFILNHCVFAATYVMRSGLVIAHNTERQVQALLLFFFTEGVLVELVTYIECIIFRNQRNFDRVSIANLKYAIVTVASILFFRIGFNQSWKVVYFGDLEKGTEYTKSMDFIYRTSVFSFFLLFSYCEYKANKPLINQNEKLTESNMTISSKKITPETEEEKNEIKKVRSKNVIESKKTHIEHSTVASKPSPLKKSLTSPYKSSKNNDLKVVTSPQLNTSPAAETKSSKPVKKVSKPLTSLYDKPTQSSLRRSIKS